MLGVLTGIFLSGYLKDKKEPSKKAYTYTTVENPKEIAVLDKIWVKESENLMVNVKIRNNSDILWDTVYLAGTIFFGNRYIEELKDQNQDIKANEEKYFELKSSGIISKEIKDSVKCDVKISAVKHTVK